MIKMTTHERMTRMHEHRDADSVPVTDSPWKATVDRWRREGMPAGIGVEDFFSLDKFANIGADNSPRYPAAVLEETPESVTRTTKWGQTIRDWKTHGGVPEFLDCKITTPDAWKEAKERMTPTRDRINWDHLPEMAGGRTLDQRRFLVRIRYHAFLDYRHRNTFDGHGYGARMGDRHVQSPA